MIKNSPTDLRADQTKLNSTCPHFLDENIIIDTLARFVREGKFVERTTQTDQKQGIVSIKSVDKGEIFIKQQVSNDKPTGAGLEPMYVVLGGDVEITKDGTRVAELGLGTILGEIAALTGNRTASVKAINAARVVEIDGYALSQLLNDALFVVAFTNVVQKRLQKNENKIEIPLDVRDTLKQPSRARITPRAASELNRPASEADGFSEDEKFRSSTPNRQAPVGATRMTSALAKILSEPRSINGFYDLIPLAEIGSLSDAEFGDLLQNNIAFRRLVANLIRHHRGDEFFVTLDNKIIAGLKVDDTNQGGLLLRSGDLQLPLERNFGRSAVALGTELVAAPAFTASQSLLLPSDDGNSDDIRAQSLFKQIARRFSRGLDRNEPVEISFALALQREFEHLSEANIAFQNNAQAGGFDLKINSDMSTTQNPDAARGYVVDQKGLQELVYANLIRPGSSVVVVDSEDVLSGNVFNSSLVNMLTIALAQGHIDSASKAIKFDQSFNMLARELGIQLDIKAIPTMSEFPGGPEAIAIVVKFKVLRQLTESQALQAAYFISQQIVWTA